MRNPWIIAQLALAAVLLVIALIGIFGTTALGMPAATYSFAGSIQAAFVFPGLVLSLVANALIMRAHRSVGLNMAEKALLIVEGVLIASLLLYHFWEDPAGNTFGLAIVTWPVLILVAVAIACVAIFRVVSSRQGLVAPAPAAPVPGTPE